MGDQQQSVGPVFANLGSGQSSVGEWLDLYLNDGWMSRLVGEEMR